jgi:hypothetical protein
MMRKYVIAMLGLTLFVSQFLFAADNQTILWLKFDEQFSKNTAVDMSDFGNDGTIVGAIDFVKDGKIGGCAKFAGGTITIKTSDSINVEQNLTIEFWIKPDKVPAATYERLIHSGWAANGTYICGIDNNWMAMGYTWDVMNNTAVRTDANMANAVQNETWQYFAATYDGKKIILYVDGKELIETPSTGKINGGGNIIIAEGFLGMMDEIRFSNVALSVEDIQKHSEGEKANAVDSSDKLATTWAGVKSGI